VGKVSNSALLIADNFFKKRESY